MRSATSSPASTPVLAQLHNVAMTNMAPNPKKVGQSKRAEGEWDNSNGPLLSTDMSVHLGPVKANSTASVCLHFVPRRQGRITIDNILLYDSIAGQYFRMNEPFEVFASAAGEGGGVARTC